MTKTDWLKRLSSAEYKKANLESWKENRDYWFSQPLRHIVDNDEYIDDVLVELIKPGSVIVDMGCGDGFLFRKIAEKVEQFSYVGLDFNPDFIRKLECEFGHDPRAEFMVCDLEEPPPSRLLNTADVVFSFFVMLEIEQIAACYSFANEVMKRGSVASIWTIDWVFLILAISRNMKDFKKNLELFEDVRESGDVPYTFQKIDFGDSESDNLTYGSVFHSTADYVNNGITVGWRLRRILENSKLRKYHPKVYHCFEFEK